MKPIFDESGVTLYCGDSRLIIPELPVYDLLVTDPPYCNGYKTNSREVLADFDAIAGDDDMGMVQDVLRESWRGLKTNRHGYVFGPITPGQVVSAEVGGVTELVWDKSSMSAGDLTAAWGRSHEPIWFGVERQSGATIGTGRATGGQAPTWHRITRQPFLRDFADPSYPEANRFTGPAD